MEDEPLDDMRFGGTEEEIIKRGSDWCTDLARVGCLLSQANAIPSRIVILYNTKQAYCGHVIIEAYRMGQWGAVDVTAGVVYRGRSGEPLSTWHLMNHPNAISDAHRVDGSPHRNADPDQYLAAAISNYSIADRAIYDYTISGINPYYRSIFEMSEQEWPGGLRWLHNVDA